MKILFHPILVHFPIAFYFLEGLLLIFWAVKKDDAYRRFALFSFKTAYGFMLVTIATGLLDAGGFGRITGLVRTHFLSALVGVFGIATARAFFWRFGDENAKSYRTIQIAGALLGNFALALTGYFGGRLVYG